MYQELTDRLTSGVARCVTEEEVRFLWLSELKSALGVQFQAERERNDAYYNGVVIEFKNAGLFGGKTSSPAFKEAVYDRLDKYIKRRSESEGEDSADYIGIATDGRHVAFAFMQDDQIVHRHLMPICESSVSLVAQALKDAKRRAVTPENLIEDFGHMSPAGAGMMQALADSLMSQLAAKGPNKIKMLFEEWRHLYGQVADLSANQVDDILRSIGFNLTCKQASKQASNSIIPVALFVIHTYDSLLIKLLGAEIVSMLGDHTAYKGFAEAASVLGDVELTQRIAAEIERGEFFSRAGIQGFVEEAIFSWYLDAATDPAHGADICRGLRQVLVGLAMYRTDNLTVARSRDVLKHFYQDLVPDALRKSLGEFYTPDWLVEVTLDKTGVSDWTDKRFLDPTCGSGSFLLATIKRIRQQAEAASWSQKATLEHITRSVWGFDLNPLAVQAARVNLLISITDLLAACPGSRIELPVLLADAVYSPARNPDSDEDTVEYTIGSQVANLKVTLPAALALDRKRLDAVFSTMGELVEADTDYPDVEQKLIARRQLSQEEADSWRLPLSETYGRVLDLHRKNWNGIWFRIVRNFFWSATAGEFDVVIGNPPWVRWSKLPELYRERVMPTCRDYDIFSSTPHHGGNELDISAMISYTVSDKWLKEEGQLAFLVTQTLFQSPSSEGFRRFRIKDGYNLIPESVDDLKSLKPFPDAANKTAIFVASKSRSRVPSYPLPYYVWNAAPGAKKVISASLDKAAALSGVIIDQQEATPVGGEGSPWAVLPVGEFASMACLTGQSEWAQGRKGVTVDLNGIYFVSVTRVSEDGNLVQIETRPEAGKTNIGPKQRHWIEPDMLYPLLKGASDFSACYVSPKDELYALVPNRGITKEEYDGAEALIDAEMPQLGRYFTSFRELLARRSTYRGRMPNAPYYAVYNVGNYTFAPWKVIWAEQKDFCAAVVSTATVPGAGERVVVPDHKLFFVDFDAAEPAYFLCGMLNTAKVRQFIESHVIKTQIGNVFKHLSVPQFDAKNPRHRELAALVEQAHAEHDQAKRQVLLAKISDLGSKLL
ncbi:N-6 DNA Methylase [Pseudomonas oleovorans subsp. oleovorans]|nr:N-6 DNA methylase [Pseudomonas oleovorans]OWK41164.1 N-6 DNA Methylase [Pseudomonas oleovorans subsp. oleovorans]SEJ64301.1 N-6 DNA Methylase [Pseudomonas oleovorans]SUE72434.1 Type I restriction-modification system methyltransferase subunit [Pseudomonas oleovorans]